MPSSTISPSDVMRRSRVIAVVGASTNPDKDAHTVPLYLKENGYRIIPINPSAVEIFGEKAYRSLSELPESAAKEIDVVEVFRPSEELPEVASQVVEMRGRYDRPYIFWSQLGLENDSAKEILSRNKVPYVMNACMRVVHGSIARR
jgi:uncharacterized protein